MKYLVAISFFFLAITSSEAYNFGRPNPGVAGSSASAIGGGGGGGANFTVVQATAINTLSGAVCAKAFAVDNTAGNLIYVGCSKFENPGPASFVSIADTNLNSYVITHSSIMAGNTNNFIGDAYAKNISGGANTVTVTMNVTGNGCACGILEIAGPSATAPIENASGVSGTGTLAGTGPMARTNGKLVVGSLSTDSTALELFVADSTSTRRVFIPDGDYNVNLAVNTSTNLAAIVTSSSTVNNNHNIGVGLNLK